MPLDLHGVEVIQLTIGGRSIPLANVSIIGCVGVAETADARAFPFYKPVAILGSRDDKRDLLGTFAPGDTLRQADGILFSEANPVCVYVRHEPGTTPGEYIANATKAVNALIEAQGEVGLKPRILIAPGAGYETPVLSALKSVAGRLRGMAYVDAAEPHWILSGTRRTGPGTNEFAGADQSAAETARDAYFAANAAVLAEYDADSDLYVVLAYADAPHYFHRVANAWVEETTAPAMRTPGPTTGMLARGLAGALASNAANPPWYGSASGGRVMLIHPWARGGISGADPVPPSPYVAALRSRLDNERGWHWSVSNQPINTWPGNMPAVDFEFGDRSAEANILNQANVMAIVRPLNASWRTWGNRVTDGSDPKFIFEAVRRAIDVINDSIQAGHLWAVDQPIVTQGVVKHVVESVNGFLSSLVQRRRIVGGVCYANRELNTAANIEQGHLFFDFKVTPAYPAEQITFRSIVTPEYLETIFT